MSADHPIRIEPHRGRVRVRLGGQLVADTTRALTLFEASYPGVHYIPREDVDMTLLAPSTHRSHCPYKGDAGYYTIKTANRTSENAVWTYESPFPDVAKITGYIAFYRDRVDGIEETPA
jgi:uncharacterized protein (DUF427 family)